MKKLEAGLLIVMLALWYLAACSQSGSEYREVNCSYKGEVCIKVSTAPTFTMGNSVPVTITVASSKDIPDLRVDINSPEVTVDGPQTWENYLSNTFIEQGFAYWYFAIKQGQTLTFRRVLHFPYQEGYFRVDVEAIAEGRVIYAIDYFNVLMTKGFGYFVKPGTPYPPYTDYAKITIYGPGTPRPTFALTLTPTQLVPLVSTSTPITSPYPPPISYP